MKNPSRATNLGMAAVVLVILPLLVMVATLGANVALESTHAQSSVFGALGMREAALGGWSILAVTIVGALIATVFQESAH